MNNIGQLDVKCIISTFYIKTCVSFPRFGPEILKVEDKHLQLPKLKSEANVG